VRARAGDTATRNAIPSLWTRANSRNVFLLSVEEINVKTPKLFCSLRVWMYCNLKKCKRAGRRTKSRNEKTREKSRLENLRIPCLEEIRELAYPHFSFTPWSSEK
jgi:hypothetical protein